MNLHKLKEAEASFLQRYPKGFADPAMEPIKKKHNVDALVRFAQANLTKVNCLKPEFVAQMLLKLVSRSSMVSRFEKPQFRDFLSALNSDEKEALAYALAQRLHGRKQLGFEQMCGLLAHHKIAKWAVVSVVAFYYAPRGVRETNHREGHPFITGDREPALPPNPFVGVLQRLSKAYFRSKKGGPSFTLSEQCCIYRVPDDEHVSTQPGWISKSHYRPRSAFKRENLSFASA